MYLVELILKKISEKRKKKAHVLFKLEEQEEELHTNCDKHIYMPIDSSCDYLACKNCGHILRNIEKHSNKNQALFDKF